MILNQARETNKVIKSDGTNYINPDFTKTMNIANPLLEKFDSYIISNFDVSVLKFDYENTYCDENHIWGLAPMHFNKNFHNSLFNRLRTIVSEDRVMQESLHNYDIPIDENLFKREVHRTKFEAQILLKNIKMRNIADSLKMYNLARIDLKNYGSKDNKIRLIEKTLPLSSITFPNWFKSDDGEGMVIESENGSINFRIECINDGILKIFLRGPDIRDKNRTRFPVYIDFFNLTINNELIFKENKLVWHDEPFVFEKEVKNTEIIDINVKWYPFNKFSEFIIK